MKKTIITLFAAVFMALGVSMAGAADIALQEWASYVDGAFTDYLPAPGSPLDTRTFTISGAGAHNVIAFFDDDIDRALNTYFNEYGIVHGAPASVQSWEIDEPGFTYGDIFTHVQAGALDNTNGVPSTAPDDVSMALGWNFNLAAGEIMTASFLFSLTAPSSGFYLEQFDPDSQASLFFSSTLERGGSINPVPEPSTILLLGAGLAGLGFYGRRRLNR